MVHLLGAQLVTLEYPTKEVFRELSVGLSSGDRIGIVGRNGLGKSSLLRLLSGRMQPDSGEVIARKGIRIGYVEQTDTIDSDQRVIDAVVGERDEHEWAGDSRIRDVLGGVLGGMDYQARLRDLSGGQQRRVSLAATLIHDWDVLMLDEPTNHLDVTGVAWLAGHLAGRWSSAEGALLVVTHDRWFLDSVTSQTWEVHNQTISRYDGGYAAYVLQRMERQRQEQVIYQRSQNLLRKELAWLRRGPPARTTKPRFRIEAAEALIGTEPPPRDQVSLTRLASARLGKTVIELDRVTAGYHDHPVLRDVTWNLAPGERTGIIANNGEGKTTLLRVLDGQLEPQSGRVHRGKTVKLARLDQRDEGLEPWWDTRVADLVAAHKTQYVVGKEEYSPGYLLEQLGFESAALSQPVSRLSGGQRRRLNILVQLLGEPNVLLLDEPTNDLDTDMLTALEDVLDQWPGTLIVVSHDRYFIERVTDQQYALIGGTLRHLPRGIDEYLTLRSAPATTGDSGRLPAQSSPAASGIQVGSKEHRAAEKEMAQIERRLGKIEVQRAELDDRAVAVDPADWQAMVELTRGMAELASERGELESRWEQLAEILDSAG